MDLTLTFVGNATVLLRYGDLTVLTDPNFLHRGQHAYLGYGLVSARRHDPAIDVRDLPPLDAIVLSHLHGDHWDRVAQRHLDRDLPVLTTPHAAKRLHRRGFSRATGLQTWQRHTLTTGGAQVVVTAAPGEHAPVVARRLRLPFGLTVTMDGRQGADLVELLSLPKVVPVHFDDYTVFASPLSDFRDEVTRRGLGDRIVYVDRGETVTL